MDRRIMFKEKQFSGGCLSPSLGYILVYDHNVKTSSLCSISQISGERLHGPLVFIVLYLFVLLGLMIQGTTN